jgi:hypothetical protein
LPEFVLSTMRITRLMNERAVQPNRDRQLRAAVVLHVGYVVSVTVVFISPIQVQRQWESLCGKDE